jgi:hypothetical protein
LSKPVILHFAIPRKEDVRANYFYDYSKNLNVVEIDNNLVPFVDISVNDLELMTKTAVEREEDDDEFRMLELETKTFVEREEDDDDNFSKLHLELLTKTKIQRESDDEA